MKSTWSRIFSKGVKMRLQGGMKNVEERERCWFRYNQLLAPSIKNTRLGQVPGTSEKFPLMMEGKIERDINLGIQE
jgi:hypothetical protein